MSTPDEYVSCRCRRARPAGPIRRQECLRPWPSGGGWVEAFLTLFNMRLTTESVKYMHAL